MTNILHLSFLMNFKLNSFEENIKRNFSITFFVEDNSELFECKKIQSLIEIMNEIVT